MPEIIYGSIRVPIDLGDLGDDRSALVSYEYIPAVVRQGEPCPVNEEEITITSVSVFDLEISSSDITHTYYEYVCDKISEYESKRRW